MKPFLYNYWMALIISFIIHNIRLDQFVPIIHHLYITCFLYFSIRLKNIYPCLLLSLKSSCRWFDEWWCFPKSQDILRQVCRLSHSLQYPSSVVECPWDQVQLPAEHQGDGTGCHHTWVPATSMGYPDDIPGTWFWLGPDLAVVRTWWANQRMKDQLFFWPHLFPSFSLHFAFWLNKYFSKKLETPIEFSQENTGLGSLYIWHLKFSVRPILWQKK